MTDIRNEQVDLQIQRLTEILRQAQVRGLKIETPRRVVCGDLQDVLDRDHATKVEISQAFSRFFATNPVLSAAPEDVGARLWLARKTLERLEA